MKLCSYWEGCKNPSSHSYGGDDYCDDHDVRTPEEATIDRLRAEVDHLRSLLSRARAVLEPIGKIAGDESTAGYRIEIWGRVAREAREVAQEIEKEFKK